MHKTFCPNCGHHLKPGQTFCGHCGYNLKTHQMSGGQPAASGMAHRPAQPMYNRPPMPPRRNNAGIVIIVILLLVILGVGGYYTYTHIIEGGPRTAQQQNQQNGNSNNSNSNNNSSSQSADKIPQNTAMNILSETFSHAEDMVNDDDDKDMSQYFINGRSNKDYNILHNWAMDQHNSESLDSVDMGVASVSGVTAGSDGASKVACHVKYQFHYDSDTKHQEFVWYAQFKKVGSSWKLASLKADNTPISNH